MSDWLALPPVRRIQGRVAVPASKSASNRALAVAALSSRPCEIRRLLDSEDITALIRCLNAMGATFERAGTKIRVQGPLGIASAEVRELDAGDSGTAARFLAALAASVPGRYRLTGSRRLSERPMAELVDALRRGGARLQPEGEPGHLPLRIEGGTLRPGKLRVDASRSSQFLSALLLAGAAIPGGVDVEPEGAIASEPYVRMTAETLRAFGHFVAEEGRAIRVMPGTDGPPASYEVPGDYSSAIPLLAACGIAGGEIELSGLVWPSADADAAAIPVLQRAGVEIRPDPERIRAQRSPTGLTPVHIRATDFPDAVPALAALAAFAAGESRFEGIAHLREKESDRIASLAAVFSAAGIPAQADRDSLSVSGSRRDAGRRLRKLPTAGDHRIAMAAALLSLRIPGGLIENPGCVAKSYPDFFRDLESISIR